MIAALGFALMLQANAESLWQERFRRLEAKVEKLQKQNDDLRTMNEALKLNQRALQTELTKLAEHMLRVRSMSGGTVAPASASPNLSKSAQPNPGPSRTVKAKVRFVNTDFKFVILNVGEAQGVEPGFQFDVWREGTKIAVLEVEAFADEEKKMTKARVKEGDIKALIVGDEGVARRVGTPNIESPDRLRAIASTRASPWSPSRRSGTRVFPGIPSSPSESAAPCAHRSLMRTVKRSAYVMSTSWTTAHHFGPRISPT